MCGIYGITLGNSKARTSIALENMHHRGPDYEGTYITDKVSMGFTRLAIINESVVDQPIHGCTERFTAFFNGEIYNYKELLKSLENKGHVVPNNHSDATVICHLMEEYGENFPRLLDGMFAISIYDNLEKILHLYRDSVGIKPIYYRHENGVLEYASEIRPLLKKDDYKNLNTLGIGEFLLNNFIDAPDTAWSKISMLDAGKHLKIEKNVLHICDWGSQEIVGEIKTTSSLSEAAGLLDDLIQESTTAQLKHGKTNAILLSGGLDSSLIATYAHKNSTKTMDAYHLWFSDTPSIKQQDRSFAKKIAKKLEMNFIEIEINARIFFEEIESALTAFYQPFAGVLSTYFISSQIAKDHKSCLTGDGADELFGSYRRVKESASKSYTTVFSRINTAEQSRNELKQKIQKSKIMNVLNVNQQELIELLSNKSVAKINLGDSGNLLTEFEYTLISDQKSLLSNQVMLFSDVLGMANSLELRPPFLSTKIIEFSRTLPQHYLIDEYRTTKKILKHVAKKYFNHDFIYREKDGFLVPLQIWMKSQYAEQWVNKNLIALKENNFYSRNLNLSFIEFTIMDYYEGATNDFYEIYKIAVLLFFLNKAVNGENFYIAE
jgi:asparagine synthase (glutamine-hydrolysing)